MVGRRKKKKWREVKCMPFEGGLGQVISAGYRLTIRKSVFKNVISKCAEICTDSGV